MNPIPGISYISESEIDKFDQETRAAGFKVYHLATGDASDKESFIRAVSRVLPLDPPIVGFRNWDALSDSLFGGLDSQDVKGITIMWTGGATLEGRSRGDFDMAVSMFHQVVELLSSEEATANNATWVHVYIARR